MYPELKDKRVGLGLTNIVLEYLEYTNRFVFTEDKLEIKEKMIAQFKASDKGFTENKIVAKQGGAIAGNARKELERKTGKKIVTSENYLPESKQQQQLKNGKKL